MARLTRVHVKADKEGSESSGLDTGLQGLNPFPPQYFSLAGRQSIRDHEKWNTALAFTSAVGTTGLRGSCRFIGFLECGTSINLSQPDTITGSGLTSCRIVVGVLVLF